MFRKHGRTAVRCTMLLKHKTLGVFEAVTRDISASGMFIGGNASFDQSLLDKMKVGDELIAKLEDMDNGTERLRLTVSRLAQDGFALVYA